MSPTTSRSTAAGDVFIVQGHTPGKGDPRVLKFDKNGNFKKSWGGLGTEPGMFQRGARDRVRCERPGSGWPIGRMSGFRFSTTRGSSSGEIKYAGLPCGLEIGDQYIYMVNGFAGQLLRLDLNGNVLAAIGKVGQGPRRVRRSALCGGEPEG